jgi:hypothetical protein
VPAAFAEIVHLDKRPAGGDGSGATTKGCLRRRGVAPLADAERRAIFMARGPRSGAAAIGDMLPIQASGRRRMALAH